MRSFIIIFILVLAFALSAQERKSVAAAATATVVVGTVLYQNDFEKAEVNKLPEEQPPFMVLEGAFAVKGGGGNKFLELPGTPLDTFGALFGTTENAGVAVSGRIHGTGKGRRFPTFGIGLNGVGGYKLQVSPGKKVLELYKGEEVLRSAPYSWESDSWTLLRLQLRKVKEGEWIVEGKAWPQGRDEPVSWMLAHVERNEPVAGRASIWGAPYAGTPIRFDDLLVVKLGGNP
jgi:hypothetical protein